MKGKIDIKKVIKSSNRNMTFGINTKTRVAPNPSYIRKPKHKVRYD